MFLHLAHTKLNVFQYSNKLVLEAYKLTTNFPDSERYAMVQQIRRASLSVHLNIAEGSSRKSHPERKRLFEISRGSLIEVDTAFDIALELGYIDKTEVTELGKIIISTIRLLSGLIK